MVNSLQQVLENLRLKKSTLALAESCTGGLLSSWITAEPGVSDVYLGSIVSYAYSAKVDLLGVPWEVLSKDGAVSESVALKMAQGVRSKFKADWSVSITGIAGPSGGTPEKPVGTVWISVIGPHFERAERKLFQGERQQVQQSSAQYALDMLLQGLRS